MAELYALQAIYPAIQALGANLVALTPQTVARSRQQLDEHPVDYDVLTDTRNQFAEAIGIRYRLPAYLAELYAGFGLDLPTFHDDDGFVLPIPARLIVDAGGIVRFSEANADYTRRPEPADTLAALEAMTSS